VGYHLGQILEKRGKNAEAIHMYALSAVASRLVPEANESLNRLAGKQKSVDLMKSAESEMRDIRTIRFASAVKSAKDSTEAQFYVSLVPGPARNAQVADVKFIRGDEKLKVLGAGLKTADFSFAFPDDTTTKVIRRGTLFCTPGTGACSFIMLTPESIASVE